ncbi:flavodoxin [uncultured Methanobrevibacter sp.]|uniref:flavodoxin family protein n=1 Tax=uncultured Methanobrevibacter sp. TaxID=253161 RepID=UPI0025FC46F3|nr:flavodoxin [uncultured Methanobrevibacter sp.]
MKFLVVYYSRTNVTKKIAEEIANELNCDIEEIKPKVNYNGKTGYVRGGKDAMSEKIIELEEFKYNPADYDIVYLGVPVWVGKSANPMISYIKENANSFDEVKFFVTAGATGFDKTFKQLEEYVGKPPLKTLTLTTKEVKRDTYREKLDIFLE